MIRKLKIRALALFAVLVFGGLALLFLTLAAFLKLATVWTPALAALVLGGALALLALLVWLGFFRTPRAASSATPGGADDPPLEALEEMLDERIDPVLGAWLRRHPQRAALVTLLLGVGAGYSGALRHVLRDLYRRYAATENERRGPRQHRQ